MPVTAEPLAPVTRTPGVCGGDACIRGTRIMVWLLVLGRRRGQSEAGLLGDYPTLTLAGLDAAWDYFRRQPTEIEQAIWLNTTAADHPPGVQVPPADLIRARLLGLSDEEIRSAYDPPLGQAELDAAWDVYRRDPQAIDRQIAHARLVA
jgi:uncharacterized protein (DUF433 family)